MGARSRSTKRVRVKIVRKAGAVEVEAAIAEAAGVEVAATGAAGVAVGTGRNEAGAAAAVVVTGAVVDAGRSVAAAGGTDDFWCTRCDADPASLMSWVFGFSVTSGPALP
jgi:hypothetical protein